MKICNLFAYLCLVLALFSTAGLRKNEDPVAVTAQTGPISLKQKLEETKDGVKGAPSPSMTFYGSQPVLTSSPVKDEKKEDSEENESTPDVQNEDTLDEDDSWEIDSEIDTKTGQESAENAVEDEDSWWSEEEFEEPPADSQSGSEF